MYSIFRIPLTSGVKFLKFLQLYQYLHILFIKFLEQQKYNHGIKRKKLKMKLKEI